MQSTLVTSTMTPLSSWKKITRFTVPSTALRGLYSELIKLSGFVITIPDFEATLPSLWGNVKGSYYVPFRLFSDSRLPEFMERYPQYIPKDNGMGFLSDDNGTTYNLCHCKCPSPLRPTILRSFAIYEFGATLKSPT
jgi:hypothetical protein